MHNDCFYVEKHDYLLNLVLEYIRNHQIKAQFEVLPMVPLVILPMVPLVANGTIGLTMIPLAYQWYQWYHWYNLERYWYTIGTIGRTMSTRKGNYLVFNVNLGKLFCYGDENLA